MPYLTPDTPPDDTICLQVVLPNDVGWIGIFKGAVSELIKTYNFELFGSYTPEQTASRFLEIYDDMVFSECDMSGCCYDAVERRVTSDGQMQIRINGGDWIPDPNDPRSTGTALPDPIIDEHHTKCDAASNGKQHLVDYINQESEALGAETDIFVLAAAIAALIVAFFFGQLEAIPLIVPLIIASIPALISLGQAAWDAYWTSDNEDIILCALFCTIGDDGKFTTDQMAAFIAKLTSDLPTSVAKDVLINQIGAMGLIGLNNACSYGASADADCSGCACEDPCDNIHSWAGQLPGTLGTVTAITDAYIEMQTEYYAGYAQWVAYCNAARPDDLNVCCSIKSFTVDGIDGGPTIPDSCPCGQDGYTTSIHNVLHATMPVSVNLVGFVDSGGIGTGTKTVRFYFGA
jgi:hypothetical protein